MIVANKMIVSADHRLQCDLYAGELKIKEPDGVERDPTLQELHKIMNGYRLFILKGAIT